MRTEPVIQIIGRSRCTGCSACAVVCPEQAISIVEDSLGFLVPLTSSYCSHCGTCIKVCPIIQEEMRYFNKPLAAYSAWSNSPQIVLHSSSGGIFSEIAKLVIQGGGKVAGAEMSGLRPEHIVTEELDEITRMRGSKYLQSKTQSLFSQIHKFTTTLPFLFSGTPCQVAAVKNLWNFHNLNPSNLITCDLICHGVPSYLLYDKYVQRVFREQETVTVDFRNKTFGWKNYSLKINSNKGKCEIIPHKKDIFMRSYLADVALRESCYKCKFCRVPRVGDITLGDFWGVPANIGNQKGTSAIIVNSQRGIPILKKLAQEGRITINEVDIAAIARKNRRLLSGNTTVPRERVHFLNTLVSADLPTAYTKFVLPIRLKNKILGALNLMRRKIRKIGPRNE